FDVLSRSGLCPPSLHDALPILRAPAGVAHLEQQLGRLRFVHERTHPQAQGLHPLGKFTPRGATPGLSAPPLTPVRRSPRGCASPDRKSTRLNSSHVSISYAVFC